MILTAITDAAAEQDAAISRNAVDALAVVEAARMFGLPVPLAMHFNAHSVNATVHTYAEVVTWAERLDVPVAKHVTDKGDAHYTATGTVAGAKVTVSAIDRVEADQ